MGDPLIHPLRADTPVEAEGELVPVERRPFQAPAAALAHAAGDGRQQRFADACAAVRRTHEQVLQPHPLDRQEAGERRKEQRVAGGLAALLRNQGLRRRTLAEQRLAQQLLVRAQLVLEVLVLRQLPEQLEQQRDILRARGAHDRRRRTIRASGIRHSPSRSGRSG